MKKGKFSSNLIFSIINVSISVIQSLWLVPFITHSMNSEAYGYIAVVMNIVNMSTIISLAITSMSARYITIELEKNNLKKTNEYFNSVLCALILVSFIITLIFTGVIVHINFFINVAIEYVTQVRILFVFSVGSLIVSFINTPFISGLYYTNRLYVMYIFSILNYVSRILFAVLIFTKYQPVIWGAYFGGFLIDLISLCYYFLVYKKQIPGLRINIKYSKITHIIDIVKSGMWVSISKLGSILLSTINTYLSNILVGAVITGIYASIIQLPALMMVMTNAIVTCFVPRMYKLHANNKKDELINYIKMAIRMTSVPLGILIGGITIFGKYFMIIWLGNSFVSFETLIILSVLYLAFTLPVELLNQLLITVNKVKIPAIVSILTGVFNVILILIFCKIFDMGIYAIAISQIIVLSLRAIVFFPIYTADSLKIKRKSFYAPLLNCPIITVITIGVGIVCKSILVPSNWIELVLDATFTSAIVFCILMVINKKLRNAVKERINKFDKKGIVKYE